MNVLFLDIDGVIRTGSDPTLLNKSCVHNLIKIVLQTDCKIVVSSNWRLGGIHKQSDYYLRLADHDTRDIIYSATIGSTADLGSRKDEIAEYLDRMADYIDCFVILDDEDCLGDLRPYLIQTKFKTGLTAEIADKIIDRFKK